MDNTYFQGEKSMGLSFRKRIKITDNLYLNLSKNGISASLKLGNITMNSKGNTSIRLAKGVSYRIPKKKK